MHPRSEAQRDMKVSGPINAFIGKRESAARVPDGRPGGTRGHACCPAAGSFTPRAGAPTGEDRPAKKGRKTSAPSYLHRLDRSLPVG